MIDLPDFEKAFEYENSFYLSSCPSRIGKLLAQYELYKLASDLPGAVVECGVFKGTSLIRFSTFRNLILSDTSQKIIAFDTFDEFPETQYESDKSKRDDFIKEAGSKSISVEQLKTVLEKKGTAKNVELISGDILETVPAYLKQNPSLKISLLNIDVDIFEPTRVILEYLYPRLIKNGILILDDYGVFPGETDAVDEYFSDKAADIKKFPFSNTPSYIIKR